MSTTRRCPNCQFSLPQAMLSRCPFCKKSLPVGPIPATAKPIDTGPPLKKPRPLATSPPPPPAPEPEETSPKPPSDIIKHVKKELARELFGDSDIAPLENLAEEPAKDRPPPRE